LNVEKRYEFLIKWLGLNEENKKIIYEHLDTPLKNILDCQVHKNKLDEKIEPHENVISPSSSEKVEDLINSLIQKSTYDSLKRWLAKETSLFRIPRVDSTCRKFYDEKKRGKDELEILSILRTMIWAEQYIKDLDREHGILYTWLDYLNLTENKKIRNKKIRNKNLEIKNNITSKIDVNRKKKHCF